MMMPCPRCGVPCGVDDLFCRRCGQPLRPAPPATMRPVSVSGGPLVRTVVWLGIILSLLWLVADLGWLGPDLASLARLQTSCTVRTTGHDMAILIEGLGAPTLCDRAVERLNAAGVVDGVSVLSFSAVIGRETVGVPVCTVERGGARWTVYDTGMHVLGSGVCAGLLRSGAS